MPSSYKNESEKGVDRVREEKGEERDKAMSTLTYKHILRQTYF
jgi:hypothetical protein